MTVRAHCQVTTFDATSNTVMTSATVNIYTPGTVTPISATIYDRLGNPLSNPLTSDATTGLCDFYLLVAQEVDLVVSKASFTTRTYSNVPVLDDSSLELTALLTSTGSMVYASSANTPAQLGIGTNTYTMVVAGGIPKWTSALQVSDANGTVGVNTAPASANALTVGGSGLTGTTQFTIDTAGVTFSSGATSAGYGIRAVVQTAAASYTMTNAYGVGVSTPTIGSGSAITNAYGVNVSNQGESGVTNAYGVYINNQSGAATTNLGLYNGGTTELLDRVGVGVVPQTGIGFTVQSNSLTGAAEYGILTNSSFTSAATTSGIGVSSNVITAAASFTMISAMAFQAVTPSLGASSAITNSYGLNVQNMGASGVTNAYGVYISAPSGASTINIGLYNAGTSQLIGGCALAANTSPPATGVLIGGATPSGVAGTLALGVTSDSVGGGATATMGTIGGTGPATAAQNAWLRMRLGTATIWVPIWT